MDFSNLTERQVLIWGGGLAALSCVLALIYFVGSVSDGVAQKAKEALLIAGAEWANIEIKGRDISVLGAAPSEQAGLVVVNAVSERWGVRVVRARYTVEPPPATGGLTASGPPITDPLACQSLRDGLLSDGGIQFEMGRADLADVGLPLLDQIGAALLRCSGFTIRIVGHTDNTGDADANLRLSQDRAGAVVAYLQA